MNREPHQICAPDKSIEIVCCLCIQDSLACHYLTPLAQHPQVSRLWIVRPRKSAYAEIPKSEYVLTPAKLKLWRWVQMWRACRRLARRPEVRAFVSFNPIPYGLIAASAARRQKTPFHFGFIGSDWYRDAKNWKWKWAMRAFREADFVTATGHAMRREMLQRGLNEEQVAVLPHCIDIERYTAADPNDADYACVFVGRLIRLKRVDVILRAFSAVVKSHSDARLCIVGDGPERHRLETLAARLELHDAVDFVGFQADVRPFISKAKISIIASDREGFPFSLVEGICCGLVPVSTPVGTIPDLIKDGENGLLFEKEDHEALARHVCDLLEDTDRFRGIREKALDMREEFSYRNATAIWDPWVQKLAENAQPNTTEVKESVARSIGNGPQ